MRWEDYEDEVRKLCALPDLEAIESAVLRYRAAGEI